MSWLSKIKFTKTVAGRAMKILFRRSQSIRLLHLDYDTEHIFENSLWIIRYRFRNALWYRFGDLNTLDKHIQVFDASKIPNSITLTVFGLFRKKVYHLNRKPTLSLNSAGFFTKINGIEKKLEFAGHPAIGIPVIQPNINAALIKTSTTATSIPDVDLQLISYNQNEFI